MAARGPKRLKYLMRIVDSRSGDERWYVRKKGQPLVRLPGPPGVAGFRDAYQKAIGGEIDPSPEPDGVGYIYFLRHTKHAVKIGHSTRPLRRIETLRTGLFGEIETVVIMPGSRADEKRLHRQLAGSSLGREWFANSVEVQRAMAQAAAYGRVRGVEYETRSETLSA